MDAISSDQSLSGLDSESPERIPTEKLTPGCIIATGPWKRHVVVELPKRLNSHTTTLAIPLRHIGGGHTVRPYLPGGDTTVRVYRTRLPQPTTASPPAVPPCLIPDEPAVGDRVVMQWRFDEQLGITHIHTFDGELWRSEHIAEDGRLRASEYSSHAVRAFVRLTDTPIEYGWYVYLPAAEQRPHLYMDGRPMPARTAGEVEVGDVILVPGGGRLEVGGADRHADGHTFRLHVLTPSRHPMRYLTWASRAGDRIEHHDSGHRGMLYVTESRAAEAATAATLTENAA
jgi:hypothetical protein